MCQCANWLRNICFAITLQVISTLAHWQHGKLRNYLLFTSLSIISLATSCLLFSG